ncbi:CoA-transferase family III [Fusarium oxysporum]|nr:CoA-transferase family III [Fusarium oxysporum]
MFEELDAGKHSPPSKSRSRPLNGITVVSLKHAVAAPFCIRQLIDLGVRVIKIERPGVGDFSRLYDAQANQSRQSLSLNLKYPKHLRVLLVLLERADLGLSYDALKKKYKHLIICDISGFGDIGPYGDMKLYDLLDKAVKVRISITNISAGTYIYTNILAALIHYQKTGIGCRVDISIVKSIVEWISFPLYYIFQRAPSPKQTGASHAAIYLYRPFIAGNREIVILGIQNERDQYAWFINNSLQVQNRDELRDIICAAFKSFGAADVLKKLEKASIANATVNTTHDIRKHPRLRARGRWTEVDTPNGRVPALTPPAIAEVDEARMDPVPALGEHNDVILAEMGMDGFKL